MSSVFSNAEFPAVVSLAADISAVSVIAVTGVSSCDVTSEFEDVELCSHLALD